MLTVNITGKFNGYEESKSQPGMMYLYVKPKATPPAGLLKTVNCPRQYGAALKANQKVSGFAILCKPEEIPAIEIGQIISLTAECWPISRPMWSDRMNAIVWGNESSPMYILSGKVSQPKDPNLTPPQFTFDGLFKSGKRVEDLMATQCLISTLGVCRRISRQ